MTKKKIPIGIENFESMRTSDFYYIDKTRFIVELLQDEFSVNLITRPRRFGKTLMMSMLEVFFDLRKDSRHFFDGLEISNHPDICDQWMNQWPVLFLSFKDIASMHFEDSYEQLAYNISNLCIEHEYLLHSNQVTDADKRRFTKLLHGEAGKVDIRNSLLSLTRMLHSHYGKQVILLIDEYDVPLAKANDYGYYKDMLDVIRGIMSTALKTNKFLKFAVVTGCLRIAKEIIFTGTNHFKASSIDGASYLDCFGFTEAEVLLMLADNDLSSHANEIKKWYDGYHFGDYDIYCPWDLVNYVSDLRKVPTLRPGNYWRDTSHNNIIRSFIGHKDIQANEKFEELLAGGVVKARIHDDLTYDFENSSEDNFWSILYLTGYLTKAKNETPRDTAAGLTCLQIPNEEVKTIFADTVAEWFKDTMRLTDRTPLMDALWNGNAEKATKMISDILFKTISYHNYKEDYYHAFLAGIFTGVGYAVESDKEHGEGRPDLVVKDSSLRRVIIIEAKHSKTQAAMEADCQKAHDQFDTRKYVEDFLDGYETIVCYGIAFFEKKCLIKKLDL